MRFVRDTSWQRFGRVVLAGSPLRLFRTTEAANPILAAIEVGDDVAESSLTRRLLDAGAIHPQTDHRAARATRQFNDESERDNRGENGTAFTLDDVTIVTPQLGGTVTADGRTTVDDGSQPPLQNATIRLEENQGPAAARNVGRRHVRTSLIAFVDADVDLLDDICSQCWLEPLLPHFDDPNVGLVAPRVAGEPGSPLDLGDEPARIRSGTRVSYVPAAAIVVRASAFDDIGGFDEALRFGEDVDFVWRLDQAGWACRYEPASSVWHEPRPGLVARLAQHVGYGTSAAPLSVRHPRSLTPLRTNAWTASAWTSVAFGHPVVGIGIATGGAGALMSKLGDVPTAASIRLAANGHLTAIRQFASAVRRVWWPIGLVVALFSKRARIVLAGAVLLDSAATPTDVAYGWGVWKGVAKHRTLRPLLPTIVRWPGTTS